NCYFMKFTCTIWHYHLLRYLVHSSSTTSVLITLSVIIYNISAIGEARERFYYYPPILFMLTVINGAFTTGDIFNMFVFFEVLLVASYVLIVLGGVTRKLGGSIKYLLATVITS